MVDSPRASTSEVLYNSFMNKIPGIQGNSIDRFPILLNSGLVNLFGGASGNLINFLMPCPWKPLGAWKICTVVPGTAAATVGIGTTAATGGILNNYSIATSEVLTFGDLTANAAFTGASLVAGGNQGDIIVFQTNGNATSTGKAIWGCVITPN